MLVDEVLAICRYAETLAQGQVDGEPGIPTFRVRSLTRERGTLAEADREAIDWQLLFPKLRREPGFWERLSEQMPALLTDQLISDLTGWAPSPDMYRAEALWRDVLQPLITWYWDRNESWDPNPELLADLVAQWRAAWTGPTVPMQMLVPIHNLAGPDEAVELEADLSLRPITDEERAQFWESFAGSPSSAGLTINQLAQWSHGLDLRWEFPRRMPIDYDPIDERADDAVLALQLLYPSAVGSSLRWSRADPPDYPSSAPWTDQRLNAPRGLPSFIPIKCSLEPFPLNDAQALLAALRSRRRGKRGRSLGIALRRFGLASGRPNSEDTLLDLWITVEALLLPDGNSELSYRASLRLARLCGDSPQERRDAFALARSSYEARSKIVHGEEPPEGMPHIISGTRTLAQKALRRWLLDRPQRGVETLDEGLVE